MPDTVGEDGRYHVKCPHPECDGDLRVKPTMPSGVYPCICHLCWVQLSWATKANASRYPYVGLAEKPKEHNA